MSAVPACTHSLGHHFEPRYSTRPSGRTFSAQGCTDETIARVMEAMQFKTYEHDICVRCGTIVRTEGRV